MPSFKFSNKNFPQKFVQTLVLSRVVTGCTQLRAPSKVETGLESDSELDANDDVEKKYTFVSEINRESMPGGIPLAGGNSAPLRQLRNRVERSTILQSVLNQFCKSTLDSNCVQTPLSLFVA